MPSSGGGGIGLLRCATSPLRAWCLISEARGALPTADRALRLLGRHVLSLLIFAQRYMEMSPAPTTTLKKEPLSNSTTKLHQRCDGSFSWATAEKSPKGSLAPNPRSTNDAMATG
ncbi:unnamed protein product [Ectocarpus fasciculatus]